MTVARAGALSSALEWLSRQRVRRLILTSIGLLALIALADLVAPSDVAMSVLYMIPVFFAATGGRRPGVAIVVGPPDARAAVREWAAAGAARYQ